MKQMLMMLVAVMLFGRTNEAAAQRPERGRRMSPEQMAEQRTAYMVQKYGLNQQQTDSIFALTMRQMEQMQSLRPSPVSRDSLRAMSKSERKAYRKANEERREAMRERMEKANEDYRTGLQRILTKEQYDRYLKDEQTRMERRPNFPGRRPGQRPDFPRENDEDDF